MKAPRSTATAHAQPRLPRAARALLTLSLVGFVVAGCGPDAPNRPPTVSGQPVTTPEDVAVEVTFTAADPDGDALTFRYSTPAHGTVAADGATITYQPAANYHGSDTVTVTVDDGDLPVTATITVTITPVNDAPVAVDDTLASGEDTATTVPGATLAGNDTDVDGDALTVTAVAAAEHGTVSLAGGTITFMPDPDFIGDGGFTYTVSDGAASASGHVVVMVADTNDPPTAVDDVATTPEDIALVVAGSVLTANDTDVEGQTLSVTAVGAASGGTVALAGGQITFTPAADLHGAASFEYTVSDGVATDTGRVAVTVTPVPDAPVAVDDTAITAEDTPLVVAGAVLAGNDTDVDGDLVTVTAVGGAVNGTVALAAGTVTFTPFPNLTGAASFTYTTSDGALTDTGAVAITITPVPDPPIAGDDTSATPEDTALVIAGGALTLNDADVDGPALTVTGIVGAVNGAAGVVANVVTFTPAPNFAGTATFDYTVSDGTLTDVGRVTVTVAPVNDAPVAAPQAVSTVENTPLLITLTAADLDSAGVTFVAGPPGLGGLGPIMPSGPFTATVTYTPPADVDGATSFTFTAHDGDLTSAAATVMITIVNVPRCGDGTDDPAEECDDGCLAGVPNLCEPADDGDGCSAVCVLECGDGDLDAGEQCDDDNRTSFDGCSATCRLETLFFSEYVEGTSNNKAIEIANPFLTPASLVGCSLRLYSNGAASPSRTLVLTQTIAAQDVFVACHGMANAAVLAPCDVTDNLAINWNGDDAIELFCNGATVDVFGQIGFDPGTEWGTGLTSTIDHTLRRKCTVTAGDLVGNDVFAPALQWDGFANDTFGNLGAYHCP